MRDRLRFEFMPDLLGFSITLAREWCYITGPWYFHAHFICWHMSLSFRRGKL